MENTVISFKVPADYKAKLSQLSGELNLSVCQLVMQALNAAFDIEPAKRRKWERKLQVATSQQ